jgi:acyl carrier protein
MDRGTNPIIPIQETPVTDDIATPLAQYIATEILKQPSRVIRGDEPLLTTGLVDSFSLIDVALYVEDHFGVRIEDTELNAQTFDTLDQLADLIQSRR